MENPFFPKNKESESGIKIIEGRDANKRPPRVLIRLNELQIIKTFINLMDHEINGFGTVKTVGNDFVIDKVFILKQYVNEVHAQTDPDALNEHVYNLVSNGGDVSDMKFQWHSHVDFTARFSSEDVETIRNYPNDLMISLVMNKFGSYECRIDLYKPFAISLNVPLMVVLPPPHKSLIGYCQREIDSKVKIEMFAKRTKMMGVEPGSLIMKAENFAEEARV